MSTKLAFPGRPRIAWLSILFVVGLLGCAGDPDRGGDGPAARSESAAVPTDEAPEWSRLRAATVHGIYEEPVALVDGFYRGEPFVDGGASRPAVQLHEDATVLGDLDGDGTAEAIALLSESGGGSGSFLYLSVFAWGAAGPENIGTELIGDRVQVRSMEFLVDKYVLDTVEAGPDESLCCPSYKRGRIVMLRDGQLEVQVEEMGRLSTRDIEGFPWEVTHLEWDRPVTENAKLRVIFVDGEMSGSAGCNKYATDYEGEGLLLTLGPIRPTRMACPEELMRLENAFLGRLEAVESFSFQFGRLLLNYRLDGALRSLVCEPRGSRR
jgi:heat shock protein HslJ